MFYKLNDEKNVVPGDLKDFTELFDGLLGLQLRRIRLDKVGDKDISTIFLGTPHGFDELDHPYLFETMVFLPEERKAIYRRLYTNYTEALLGHRSICNLIANKPLEEPDEEEECACLACKKKDIQE